MIENVFDADRQSHVIQLIGSGKGNGYRLRNDDFSKWHNSIQFVVEWSMKYSEGFTIYIDVETTAGQRYMVYTPVDYDNLGDGGYVHHGLGSKAIDGQWSTLVCDPQTHLAEAQPGVTILEVNGFLVRDSGSVDDIKLHSSIQIYLGTTLNTRNLESDTSVRNSSNLRRQRSMHFRNMSTSCLTSGRCYTIDFKVVKKD